MKPVMIGVQVALCVLFFLVGNDGVPTEFNVLSSKDTTIQELEWNTTVDDGDPMEYDYTVDEGASGSGSGSVSTNNYGLPPSEVEKYRQLFDYLDTDKNGVITRAELPQATYQPGPTLQSVMDIFSEDENALMNFDEFLMVVSKTNKEIDKENIRRIFAAWDLDDDGWLSAYEFSCFLTCQRKTCVDAAVAERYIQDFLKKNVTALSFDDFESWYRWGININNKRKRET